MPENFLYRSVSLCMGLAVRFSKCVVEHLKPTLRGPTSVVLPTSDANGEFQSARTQRSQ